MSNSELGRIKKRYQERDGGSETNFWSLKNPVVMQIHQQRERLMLNLLDRFHIDLANSRILDVGCGMGSELVNYLRWGACKDNVVGVDLLFSRLLSARQNLDATVINCSGDRLPFSENEFDVVFQNAVFTSIIDSDLKKGIADEMIRVLRPGGYLIWYDAVKSRKPGPHYRPVPVSEIRELFCSLDIKTFPVTTDLGLLKLINKTMGQVGLQLIDMVRPFQTHVIAVGNKVNN